MARSVAYDLSSVRADPDRILTSMGPSNTESLSGYRLGVAFGAAHLVDRMGKLQAIVSLRAPAVWSVQPATTRGDEHA